MQVTISEDRMGLLIECLRYAGIVSDVKDPVYNDTTVYTFELHPPKGVSVKAWEDMNCKRMASFGIVTKKS